MIFDFDVLCVDFSFLIYYRTPHINCIQSLILLYFFYNISSSIVFILSFSCRNDGIPLLSFSFIFLLPIS
jgi:hypothetical protein